MRGRRRERLRVESRTRYNVRSAGCRTAVRWGPQFSSSAPPRSPAPSFAHFPFGPRLGHIVTTNRPCDSRDSISPSFDSYTNVLNDLTAIFRPIAVRGVLLAVRVGGRFPLGRTFSHVSSQGHEAQ